MIAALVAVVVQVAARSHEKTLDQVGDQHVQFLIQGDLDNSGEPIAQTEGCPLADDKHVYRPAAGIGNADYIRRGANDEGPYSFVVYPELDRKSTRLNSSHVAISY